MSEPSSPEISTLDVLTAQEQSPLVEKGLPKELKESISRGKKLQQLKESDATGKERFEANRPKRIGAFTDLDRESMALQFAAGFAEKDGDEIKMGEEIEDESLKLAAESNLESAKKTLHEISSVLSYTEIMQEAQQSGKKPEDVASEKKITDWNNLRNTTLDRLMSSNAIQEGIPQLAKIKDIDARRQFIESTLGSDPRLLEAVLKNVNEVKNNMSLVDVEQDEELSQAQEKKKAGEQNIQESIERVYQLFENAGMRLNPEEQKYVNGQLQRGIDAKLVLLELRQHRMNDDFRLIERYHRAAESVRRAQQRFNELSKKNLTAQVEQAQKELDGAKNSFSEIEGEYNGVSDKDIKEAQYAQLLQLTSLSLDNSTLTAVGQEMQSVANSRAEVKNAQEVINTREKKARKTEQIDIRKRLSQESDVLIDLEGVIDNAVVDVLVDRYDEAVLLEEQRLEEEAQKKEEEGKKAEAEAIRALGRAEKSRRMSYDENERDATYNVDKTMADLRYLIYNPDEESIKRIMARDMLKFPISFTDESGTKVTISQSNFRELNLEKLSDEQKQVLESVFQSQKDRYVEALLKSFGSARHAGLREKGILWKNKLRLRDHEWDLLQQNFPDILQKGLSTEAGQAVMSKLEAKGEKIDSETSWVIALLGLLGVATVEGFKQANRAYA